MKKYLWVQKSRNTKSATTTRRGWRDTARTSAPKAGASSAMSGCRLGARWVGEHLVCSPCGEVAGRELNVRGWPGSGGAAVALAASKPYIIPLRLNFKPQSWLSVLDRLLPPAQLHQALEPRGSVVARLQRFDFLAMTPRCSRVMVCLQVVLGVSLILDGPGHWAAGCHIPSVRSPGPRTGALMPTASAAQGWGPCSWKLAVEPGEQVARAGPSRLAQQLVVGPAEQLPARLSCAGRSARQCARPAAGILGLTALRRLAWARCAAW